MRSPIGKDQIKRIASFLSHQRTCIISTITAQGVWSIPVRYRSETWPKGRFSLVLDCLVPRWADIAHYLTELSRVVVIVQAPSGVGLRWLQIQGTALPIEAPEWARLLPRWVNTSQPDAYFKVVRVNPSRIDLIDEDQGWGVQETLE